MTSSNDPLGLTVAVATCPNELRATARVAIVGEAPRREEVDNGLPFIGGSGRLMWAILGNAGISRSACSVLNVSQTRPVDNDFQSLDWAGPEVQSGLAAVRDALAVQRPNVVLVLGNAALCAAKGGTPVRKGKAIHWPWSIMDWTGSLFWSPVWNCKCLACVHPASILRQYQLLLYLRVAATRLAAEARSAELKLAKYHLATEPNLDSILSHLYNLTSRCDAPGACVKVALDIEGGLGTLSCISFAIDGERAFIVPLTRADGTSLWSLEEEVQVWRALAAVVSNPRIPKVLQNYL